MRWKSPAASFLVLFIPDCTWDQMPSQIGQAAVVELFATALVNPCFELDPIAGLARGRALYRFFLLLSSSRQLEMYFPDEDMSQILPSLVQ